MRWGDRAQRGSYRAARVRLVIAVLISSILSAGEATLLTADGRQVTGALALSGAGITVGAERVDAGKLVAFSVAGDRAESIDQGIMLQDGTVLRGLVGAVQGGQVRVDSDQAGVLNLPLAKVRALILTSRSLAALDALPVDQGGTWLANGDRVTGTCVFLNDQTAGIDTGRKVLQVPRARVELIVFGGSPTPAGAWRLLLADGSRLAGELGGGGSPAILSAIGAIPVPVSLVRAGWAEGGSVQSLGGLALPAALSKPLLDEPGLLVINRDPSGGALRAAGRQWDRGLYMRAGSSIAVPVAGAARLVAEVAVSDGAQGGVEFRVLKAGAVVWTSGLRRAGDPPVPCNIPIEGADTLTLDTGRPAGSALAGTGIWGWAALVR